MTYIIVSYILMIIREASVAFRVKKAISFKSWVVVALAPITLPLMLALFSYEAYKEVKENR